MTIWTGTICVTRKPRHDHVHRLNFEHALLVRLMIYMQARRISYASKRIPAQISPHDINKLSNRLSKHPPLQGKPFLRRIFRHNRNSITLVSCPSIRRNAVPANLAFLKLFISVDLKSTELRDIAFFPILEKGLYQRW